ncbi:MAG TPA: reverse transcriptase domain-containing protein [Gammaproteobacteria bacterium]|nr:reverse transcriptase domain-containing protein [Gammaproteobacteria bacterium]
MGTTETSLETDTKLKRIAWLSACDSHKRFDSLRHHFNERSLAACFHELDGTKAVGIDGVDKAHYGADLDDNLRELVARMKCMAYRPAPVRQVLIPKDGKPGATRPLGVSTLEDKIVQKMMQKVLENIYEPLSLDCSYGFRPGRSCHDALRALHRHLFQHEVQTGIDVDLANFFDPIDHRRLVDMLSQKIGDERFIRYLIRMFKAGVLAEGDLKVSEEGVPQGNIASPILANIFAHHVIDLWFETVVKVQCAGRIERYRYGDDMVICCQYECDAQRIVKALQGRLIKYGLQLNEEKTRLVAFSKRAYRNGDKQGVFEFLGFTFYWGRSRRGAVIPKVKTSGKRLRSKLKRVSDWARYMRGRYPLRQVWALFCAKVEGHIRYYGVSFNTPAVGKFLDQATRILFKHLNRRSQRRSFNWEQFRRFIQRYPLPKVTIYHALF